MDPNTIPIRDIHLPDAVSWWPPALGWWMFLAFAIILAVLFVFWLSRYRRLQLRRSALKELRRIEQEYQVQKDANLALVEMSKLLRQVCIRRYGQSEVAGLTGQRWLDLLDRSFGREQEVNQKMFQNGVGQCLVTVRYQPKAELELGKLIRLCRDWIRAIPPLAQVKS